MLTPFKDDDGIWFYNTGLIGKRWFPLTDEQMLDYKVFRKAVLKKSGILLPVVTNADWAKKINHARDHWTYVLDVKGDKAQVEENKNAS